MNLKSIPARIKSWLGSAEGAWRGPFMGVGEFGGVFGMGQLEDGWQRNLNVNAMSPAHVPIVYSCVMACARAVSMCYATHRRVNDDGRHVAEMNTWVARLLRNPNEYETWPQLILNIVCEMLFRGESLVVMQRNGKNEVVSLHRVQSGHWQPYIAPDDDGSKAVFYGISEGGNPLNVGELTGVVPARDVIHFRQHTPRHPLIGESPITAAALAIGINVALSKSQAAFFSQMRRPSGVISTDLPLTAEQVKQLRKAFDEQAATLASGGLPILAHGLKFQPMSITSQDAQLIEAQRMSIEDVCRVFGVPPPIVADLSHATLQNAETLINHWLALGLGSLLENIERSFDKAFRFTSAEYIELDTTALLRTDFVSRVEGLAKAVQGGIMSPDEARSREGLPPTDGGDTVLVQSQMVSVAYASAQRKDEPAPAPTPTPPAASQEPKEEPKAVDAEITKALVVDIFATMRKAA